eukprot:5041471-Amphidinium_carterae.1
MAVKAAHLDSQDCCAQRLLTGYQARTGLNIGMSDLDSLVKEIHEEQVLSPPQSCQHVKVA